MQSSLTNGVTCSFIYIVGRRGANIEFNVTFDPGGSALTQQKRETEAQGLGHSLEMTLDYSRGLRTSPHDTHSPLCPEGRLMCKCACECEGVCVRAS